LVALYHLSKQGWETCAYIIRARDPADPLSSRLAENGGRVIKAEDDKKSMQLLELLKSSSILLDGVFGTGIKLPLKEEIAKLLQLIKSNLGVNGSKIHVVAVDCPSGVDCETCAAADEVIPAELTITMAGIKYGLIQFPAARLAGEIRVISIGPVEDYKAYKSNQKIVLTAETIKQYLPERPIDAHKGTFGTAFIVAGSVNYTGAALLAGLAAYRSGAGLVTLAIPALLHTALAGEFPESTWVILPDELGVISADTTRDFLTRLFSDTGSGEIGEIGFIQGTRSNKASDHFQKPIVMDADGLKLISKIPDWYKLLPSPAILTPHPGEMSVLTGLPVGEIQRDRIGNAGQYSQKWGHVIVLKGAYTVIAAPDGSIAIVPVATPALARAGTGDVLAGLIVGLRAQGVDAYQAACAGAWMHATAGILAAKRLGTNVSVIARDVLDAVPQVLSDLFQA
jgi:hydroxyethylthiazole kinase-like uncharacterized protein yjeF